MRLVLTNDDGIEAPGLAALESAMADLGPMAIVAPDQHLSGCSHQATTDRPLTVIEPRPKRYAVDGTPADCVRLAVRQLAPDLDWVLAGINDGGNLGVDTFMSGTVAAAREASLFGKRAMAVSHYHQRDQEIDWKQAARQVRRVFDLFRHRPLPVGAFWNVNLPAAYDGDPEIIECPLDPHPLPVQFESEGNQFLFRGDYHGRPRHPGSDVAVCFSGNIAVTLIHEYRTQPDRWIE